MMLFEKYIKIKNLMRVHQLYQISFQDRTFINDEGSIDDRDLPSEKLLSAMCELEREGKYPKSSELLDIIEFIENNPEAIELKIYLKNLDSYDVSLKKNQKMKTRIHHQINSDGLHHLPEKKSRDIYKNCCIDLSGDYIISWHEKGITLNINIDGFKIKAEMKYELPEDTYIINNVVFENLKFNELINIITYSKYVKDLNLQNTQAAFFFLKSQRN